MWRVLSIGRDPLLLETRRLLLKAYGCEVVSATNFTEVFKRCKGEHFDVAVLCHTLGREEIEAAYRVLADCVFAEHVLRLQQQEDINYDPSAFIHRVQRVASSM